MDTVGKRLKAFIEYKKTTQFALSQAIGLTKGYVSVVVNDKEPITASFLQGLTIGFPELNLHWLLTGKGGMLFVESYELLLPLGDQISRVNEDPPVLYHPDPLARFVEFVREMQNKIITLESEVEYLKHGEGIGGG